MNVEQPEALGREEILALFHELDEALGARETTARMQIFGGACMALAYARGRTTNDIDTDIESGELALREAVEEVGRARGLDAHWLDTRAAAWSEDPEGRAGVTLFQGRYLSVTSTPTQHMLAMKLEASRPRDQQDIERLMALLNISSADDALAVHHAAFPNSRRTALARQCLERIAMGSALVPPTPIETLRQRWREALEPNAAPRYRTRPVPSGLEVTRQRPGEAAPRSLGVRATIHTAALLERLDRRWPVEAQDEIEEYLRKSLGVGEEGHGR